jgi:CheY-like chemotaxis protein
VTSAIRVLIVEDDDDIRTLFEVGLTLRGFIVETAANGRDGMQAIASKPPSVIVADLHMPVMDGWSFLTALSQDPRLSRIPVIILTAADDPSKTAPRPETILIKPVAMDELAGAITAAVAKTGVPLEA